MITTCLLTFAIIFKVVLNSSICKVVFAKYLALGWEGPVEKEMETHSSILAWRIPWTEESGELQSMGSQRAGHDCATNTVQLEVVSYFFQYN